MQTIDLSFAQDPNTLSLALIAGVIPAFLWILFWVRETRARPRTIGSIFFAFLMGVCMVVLALPVEKFMLLFSHNPTVLTVLWAGSEELLKFGAFLLVLLMSSAIESPIDYPIYMMIVALGFVMRAIGGAAATNTPISKWFLVVTAFGSLVVVTSKRLAEAESLANVNVRPVIREYPLPFLRFVLATSAGVTLTGYSLWALSLNQSTPYAAISLLPLCLGLFRYVWMVEKGSGEVPEDLLLRDPVLITSAVSIALLLAFSIYP